MGGGAGGGPVGWVGLIAQADPGMGVGEGVWLWESVAHVDGEFGVVAEGGEDGGVGGEEMAESELVEGWVGDGKDGLAVIPGRDGGEVDVRVWVTTGGCFFGAEVEGRCFLSSGGGGIYWVGRRGGHDG